MAAIAAGAAAELDATGVQRHDGQPVGEGAVGAVAVEEAVDVHEDFLDDVLGLALVAEDARRASLDPGGVALDEEREGDGRIRPAGLAALDELRIRVVESPPDFARGERRGLLGFHFAFDRTHVGRDSHRVRELGDRPLPARARSFASEGHLFRGNASPFARHGHASRGAPNGAGRARSGMRGGFASPRPARPGSLRP